MYKCIYNKNLHPKELSQINKKESTQFFFNGQRTWTDTSQKEETPTASKYEKFSIIS